MHGDINEGWTIGCTTLSIAVGWQHRVESTLCLQQFAGLQRSPPSPNAVMHLTTFNTVAECIDALTTFTTVVECIDAPYNIHTTVVKRSIGLQRFTLSPNSLRRIVFKGPLAGLALAKTSHRCGPSLGAIQNISPALVAMSDSACQIEHGDVCQFCNPLFSLFYFLIFFAEVGLADLSSHCCPKLGCHSEYHYIKEFP